MTVVVNKAGHDIGFPPEKGGETVIIPTGGWVSLDVLPKNNPVINFFLESGGLVKEEKAIDPPAPEAGEEMPPKKPKK